MIIKETTKKTSEILAEMKSKFDVYCYLSDKELDKQFPPPKEITEREFLDNVEPDPKTLGKSVIEVDPDGSKGITLRERMLMELDYFDRTGKHLDIKGITICSGARDSDGNVPSMYWHPDHDGVEVDWCSLNYSYPTSGLRSAVSLKSSPSNSYEITEIKLKVGNKEITFIPK